MIRKWFVIPRTRYMVFSLVLCLSSVLIGYVIGNAMWHSNPAPCQHPYAMASGDQMLDTHGRIWTCTDGVLHLR